MTWTEIKIDGYDFCMESGDYQVRRKGEQVGLYYYDHRTGWYKDVKEGMFRAWVLELYGRKRNG